MNDFILVVGVLLLALVWWDSFVTVFSMDGAGPVTNFWTRVLWKGLLTLHERISCHWLLSMAGPLILVLTILVWCFAHAVAWTMIFISRPGSVVDDARGLVATPMETLYFVGTTVSSLGYGDFTPAAPPWTWLSNVACFSATIILTVSLSYVLAVLSAALEKHVLAQSVFGLGKDIESFIRNRGVINKFQGDAALAIFGLIAAAGTVVWNGPVGVFEFDAFGKGTETLARAIADSKAFSIAGGGDTLAAVDKYGIADGVSYISTGGGAFLEFLEGKELPAVAALEQRAG